MRSSDCVVILGSGNGLMGHSWRRNGGRINLTTKRTVPRQRRAKASCNGMVTNVTRRKEWLVLTSVCKAHEKLLGNTVPQTSAIFPAVTTVVCGCEISVKLNILKIIFGHFL